MYAWTAGPPAPTTGPSPLNVCLFKRGIRSDDSAGGPAVRMKSVSVAIDVKFT